MQKGRQFRFFLWPHFLLQRTGLPQLLLSFLLLLSLSTLAKGSMDEEIRNRQRSIFIYNFTQLVKWEQFSIPGVFRIGVLGDDPFVKELKRMAQKRTVDNQAIEVLQLNRLSDLQDIDLLYVNSRYNYNIQDVLAAIAGKQTLLVSENYAFNTSMINMIEVEEEFKYEINEQRLEQEEFIFSETLKSNAISNVEKWQELYLESAKKLNAEREKVLLQRSSLEQQSKLLENQAQRLADQEDLIARKSKEIEQSNRDLEAQQLKIRYHQEELLSLINRNDSQRQRHEWQERMFQNLKEEMTRHETQIAEQQELVKEQQEVMAQQEEFLSEQRSRMSKQEEVLGAQIDKLRYQKQVNLLLFCISGLCIFFTIIVFRSNQLRKKANRALARKNQAVQSKSKELHKQKKAMEQFAYIASHDLKEPLSTITGLIHVLELENGDQMNDVGKQSMQLVLRATARMNERINGLLEYSTLGNNVQLSPVESQEVLTDVQADLSKVIEETGAEIAVGKMPVIMGHASELGLLFQNLISNAIKFRKVNTSPKIVIQSKEISSQSEETKVWHFSIQDNGIGIPPGQKKKIFEIFSRLHTSKEYQGTGIGLAHCQKIVELHGGKIWVVSEIGKGSTFHFTLKGDSVAVA